MGSVEIADDSSGKSGFEVIKLEYNLRRKIKRNDWLLADTCVRKQPIIALYYESENELTFYNLEAKFSCESHEISPNHRYW